MRQQDPATVIDRLLSLPKMDLVYLFGEHATAARSAAPEPDATKGPRVFLSYAHADEAFVQTLYDRLMSSGFRPWMDARDIHAGEDWRAAIQMALEECDLFALCLSHNSVERRGFLQREIKIALDKLMEFLPDDIYFIPIRLANCPRPPQIARYQTLDLFEPDGYERLVIALREGATRRRKGMQFAEGTRSRLNDQHETRNDEYEA